MLLRVASVVSLLMMMLLLFCDHARDQLTVRRNQGVLLGRRRHADEDKPTFSNVERIFRGDDARRLARFISSLLSLSLTLSPPLSIYTRKYVNTSFSFTCVNRQKQENGKTNTIVEIQDN